MIVGAASYTIFDKPLYSSMYEKEKEDVPRWLNKILEEVKDNRVQTARMNEAASVINDMTSILDSVVAAPQHERLQILEKQEGMLAAMCEHLFAVRQKLLDGVVKLYQRNAESLEPDRLSLKLLIATFVVADIFFAAVLLYLFSKEITTRLALLSENAALFAARKPLKEPMEGGDEVARLDKSFHEMAQAITLAEQRKQEFVSMISHDVRTPLSAAMNSVELVNMGVCGDLTDDTKDMLARAERNIKAVLKLINELLDIEKMEAGMLTLEYTEISIKQAIAKSVELVRTIAEQKQVKIEEPLEDVRVEADEDRLVRVLTNLLGNALKFTPDNSTISISCQNTDNQVTVKVKDEGPGIPPEYLDKVFDRFQQVKGSDAKKGSGLGLAICKAIIEAHKGEIGVTSTPGEGATFWFRIPCKKSN